MDLIVVETIKNSWIGIYNTGKKIFENETGTSTEENPNNR